MGAKMLQPFAGELWRLVRAQHGVVSRRQLLEHGVSAKAVRHRVASGRLHTLWPGVYAVGRPDVGDEGQLMAATLATGAALSHMTAASFLEIVPSRTRGPLELSRTGGGDTRIPGLVVHRRARLDTTTHRGIPVTTPAQTLLDIASRFPPRELEGAVNEADKHDLVDPDALRAYLESAPAQPGVVKLRGVLDRATFVLTDTGLERLFLPIARAAGLPPPVTQRHTEAGRVDFAWPALGLVVETDGLRYHRTPLQQAEDRRRDQLHTAAGLTPLRYTHGQIRYEPGHVRETLERVARRLLAPGGNPRHC